VTKDEALKLALEALEEAHHKMEHYQDEKKREQAITAIKQALAAPVQKRPQNCGTSYCSCIECVMDPEPVQEPVAWEQFYPDIGKPKLAYLPPTKSPENACYTTPPAAQPEQKAVGWMSNKDFEPIRIRIMQEAHELADRNDSEGYNAIKAMCGDVQKMLPPQRPWVGLTEADITAIFEEHEYSPYSFIELTEIKLKEKNA
jgi:hypothetical protein